VTIIEAAASLIDLEEDGIPEWTVIMVGYLSSDGDQGFKYKVTGDTSLTTIRDALMSLHHDVLHRE
jgi:hypothetical protein